MWPALVWFLPSLAGAAYAAWNAIMWVFADVERDSLLRRYPVEGVTWVITAIPAAGACLAVPFFVAFPSNIAAVLLCAAVLVAARRFDTSSRAWPGVVLLIVGVTTAVVIPGAGLTFLSAGDQGPYGLYEDLALVGIGLTPVYLGAIAHGGLALGKQRLLARESRAEQREQFEPERVGASPQVAQPDFMPQPEERPEES